MRTIETFRKFRKQAERLSKEYRTLFDEIKNLSELLETAPKQGKDLGAGLYKIRPASRSKNPGKSGGFRVVTYYVEQIGDEKRCIWSRLMTSQKETRSPEPTC